MKKILVLGLTMLIIVSNLTGCNNAERTTEYWDYNSKTGKYELTKTEEEDIDGIFDENIEIRFGEVQIEAIY